MIYYNATKQGLLSIARDLRYLGAPHNIKVSVITPGFIDTPMMIGQPFNAALSWLFASPRSLATITKWQLYANRFEITWPFLENLPVLSVQSLPPRVMEFVTNFAGCVGGFLTDTGNEDFS